jgi:hypothetical protein
LTVSGAGWSRRTQTCGSCSRASWMASGEPRPSRGDAQDYAYHCLAAVHVTTCTFRQLLNAFLGSIMHYVCMCSAA